jgi:hypothetical protein
MLTKITVALLASILICGCSTSATISRLNGMEVNAKIQRSTASDVLVRTADGSEVSIARADITDIDHPGNATAVAGVLLGAYGAVNIALRAQDCERGGAAYCTGVFLPAAAGLSMFIWGMATWIGSTSAASGSPNPGAVPAAPPAAAFNFTPAASGASAGAL